MTRASCIRTSAGFSLLELMVALAISLLITSAVFAMLDPSAGAFQTQPEAADVAQRLRAAADAMFRDFSGAGSGPVFGGTSIGAAPRAAAVFPYRIGRRNADAAGTFDPTRVSIWQVNPSAPQATLAAPLASGAGVATIAPGPGCAAGDMSCGFRPGMLVGVFSHSGTVDLFSVTSVSGTAISLQHNQADSPRVYPAGQAVLAQIEARTYFLRFDPVLGFSQLRRYDTAGGADVPVVDHLSAMTFEYYGDAEPPRLVAGAGPERVTYGPTPPRAGVQLTAYPPGENCAFARTAGGIVSSRLAALATEPVLVRLSPGMLTDGPWCPDDQSPIRYDADLLRVRQIVATVRVEAAVDSLRGPAGLLFARGGTAKGPKWVPDRQARLAIAPRPLNVGY